MLLKFIYRKQRYATQTIKINGIKIKALRADSFLKRMIGLMYREKLGTDSCMLFVFGHDSYHAIWSYNMRFAIDVIWVGNNSRVIDFAERVMPCKTIFGCRNYMPSRPAKYIIETNAGFVKKHRVHSGNIVTLQ